MAQQFHDFEALVAAVEDREFDATPAIVCNAHITGLAVARSLNDRAVPVIAVDRNGDGVATHSETVTLAGEVTYPLDDAEGFREDIERLADAVTVVDRSGDVPEGQAEGSGGLPTDDRPVVFPCMDEWVHALVETRPDGVHLPFAPDGVESLLDKTSLYALADECDVPYPETYRVEGTGVSDDGPLPVATPEDAAAELGFPLVVKPARKREFEEAIGTNVLEATDEDELAEAVAAAREHDVRLLLQEKVPVATGEDHSLVSYRPDPERDDLADRHSEPITFVGNAAARHPREYGTACYVERVEESPVEDYGRQVLESSEYYGISEAEFVYDTDRQEYVLLDVNTRPWKWIGLPHETDVNIPFGAYVYELGASYRPGAEVDCTWVSLLDYAGYLMDGGADYFDDDDWHAILSGRFEYADFLATAVYRPSDLDPILQYIRQKTGTHEYYCAC